MLIHYQPPAPIIAGFFGYAPVIQGSLILLVCGRLGDPVKLVRVHTWTQRAMRPDQAYVRAASRGRPVNVSELKNQQHEETQEVFQGALEGSLARLLVEARLAAHEGFSGSSGHVLCYCFAHPLNLSRYQGNVRYVIPDTCAPDGSLPRHLQLWDCRWTDDDRPALQTLLSCFIRRIHPIPDSAKEG